MRPYGTWACHTPPLPHNFSESRFLLGFYGMLIGGMIGFITLFALARQLDPKVSRLLSAVSATALLFFGLYQLWQGGVQLFAG